MRALGPILMLTMAITTVEAPPRKESQLSSLRGRLDSIKPYESLKLEPALPVASREHLRSFELPVDESKKAILLVGPWDSILLVFNTAGKLIHQRQLPKVDSVQTLDLDSDGSQEILMDQVDGTGSGLLLKRYHLYSIADHSIRDCWQGDSLVRFISPGAKPSAEEKLAFGFVKLEPARAGFPGRLFHILESRSPNKKESSLERHVYVMNARTCGMKEAPWPGES